MPTQFDPRDVRLLLSFPRSTSGTGNRRVDLEAEHADTGDHLFRLSLSAEEFAALMSSRATVARSWSPVPRAAAPVHPPVRWLEVTLTATSNPYLATPCDGQLQVTEYSTDGHVIHAIFRRRGDDGALSAPVEVAQPEWVYRGRGQSRTHLCPHPGAHEPDCANQPHSDLGDCDGHVREYTVVGTLVAGYSSGELVPLCASHAQFHGRHIRKPAPAVQP